MVSRIHARLAEDLRQSNPCASTPKLVCQNFVSSHVALSFIPEWSDTTPGERAWVNFLDIEAIPLTAAIFKLGQRLLSHEADEGRHPDEGVDEFSLLYEIVEAFCARADVTVPMMGERASRRAKAALALVASRTHEFAALESEADHD